MSAQQWKTDIAQYFDTLRGGARASVPSHAHDLALASELVDMVNPYLSDSLEVIRIRSRELVFAVASASASVRSQAIDNLLEATYPLDPVTTGLVLDGIKTFSHNDFSNPAKASIRRIIAAEGPYLSEWFRVAAFLDLRDLVSTIRPYAQPGNRQALRWSALVSLARMEEAWAREDVVKRAKRLPVNDDLVYNIFPDLLFTRDRSAIDYMIEILHQDEENCLSADAETETKIPCGYRIMEQLAPVIEGFPVELDDSGDIRTSDYPKTLAIVRQWLLSHRDYGISRERY